MRQRTQRSSAFRLSPYDATILSPWIMMHICLHTFKVAFLEIKLYGVYFESMSLSCFSRLKNDIAFFSTRIVSISFFFLLLFLHFNMGFCSFRNQFQQYWNFTIFWHIHKNRRNFNFWHFWIEHFCLFYLIPDTNLPVETILQWNYAYKIFVNFSKFSRISPFYAGWA